MESPRNRKQRRAARSSASSSSPSIPLARPPREPPKTTESSKTLVDLIAERQATIPNHQNQKFEFITVDPSTLSEHDTGPNPPVEILPDQPLPPLIDTILLSLPLSALHLTLSYLAAHQYADKTHLPSLFRESALVALPMLTLLIHLAHGHVISFDGRSRRGARKGQGRRKNHPPASSPSDEVVSFFPLSREKFTPSFLWKLVFPPTLRTSIFLTLAILLGSKLISITNEDPYYAVMKRAPAIGTLWVWSILEIPLGAAIIGALGPLGWGVWWMGYGIV